MTFRRIRDEFVFLVSTVLFCCGIAAACAIPEPKPVFNLAKAIDRHQASCNICGDMEAPAVHCPVLAAILEYDRNRK